MIKNKSNRHLTGSDRINLKELFNIIKDAHEAYEIWWLLISLEGRKQYGIVMWKYKDFFESIARSSLTTMVISLYKLYDDCQNVLSLTTMLKKIKVDLVSDKKLSRRMSEAKILWKKIRILRHNLLAHRSIKLTKQEIYKKANLRPNRIKRLIRVSEIIFNNLWTISGDKPKQLEDYVYLDFHHILEKLES